MRVMALFSTSFFAKYLRGGEDGPGWGHLCHTDTFLVFYTFIWGTYRESYQNVLKTMVESLKFNILSK